MLVVLRLLGKTSRKQWVKMIFILFWWSYTGPAQQVFEWGGGGGGAKDEHVSQIGVGGGNA